MFDLDVDASLWLLELINASNCPWIDVVWEVRGECRKRL